MREIIRKIDQEERVSEVIPEAGIIAGLLLANPKEFNLEDRKITGAQIFDPSLDEVTYVRCDIAKIIATYNGGGRPFFIVESSEEKVMGLEIEDQAVLFPSGAGFSKKEVLTPEIIREIIKDGGRVGIAKRTNPRQAAKIVTSESTIVLRKEEIETTNKPEDYSKQKILWRVPEEKRKVFEQGLREIALNIEENQRTILTRKGKRKELLRELKELVKQSVSFYAAFFPEGSMRREVLNMPPSAG